jgi:hypothetical protein
MPISYPHAGQNSGGVNSGLGDGGGASDQNRGYDEKDNRSTKTNYELRTQS